MPGTLVTLPNLARSMRLLRIVTDIGSNTNQSLFAQSAQLYVATKPKETIQMIWEQIKDNRELAEELFGVATVQDIYELYTREDLRP